MNGFMSRNLLTKLAATTRSEQPPLPTVAWLDLQKFDRCASILLVLVMIVCFGCGKDAPTDSTASSVTSDESVQSATLPPDPKSFDDGLTATQILSQSMDQYKEAESYSDKGVLYLSYWMNGRPVQEPQNWATSWTRGGQFAAALFNSKIQCDGSRLGCYVYDIDSGNLDGQRLLLPADGRPPIAKLFADSIAAHFLSGESELPLENISTTRPLLIPPAIGLLTGQMIPLWLAQPESLVRMADAKIDNDDCYVVRFENSTPVTRTGDGSGQQNIDIWIDSNSGVIRQVALPTIWLDDKVRTSTEITDLQFVARFFDAELNSPVDPDVFQLQPIAGSTPVSRFVQLPESIPAGTIGIAAPPFELETLSGKTVSALNFDGHTTVLMWIAGERSYPAIEKLKQLEMQLASQNPDGKFHLAVVYTDSELAMPEVKTNSLNEQLGPLQQSTRLPFYFDRQLSTSALMKLEAVPCIVVLDGDSKVQFARKLTDQAWFEDVQAAAIRVEQGEDVATEMLADYRSFLEQYHTQLTAVTATQLGSDLTAESTGMEALGASLVTELVWSNPDFKMPGNVVATADDRLFALDGWRTLVELDFAGNTVARHELELPENEAVSSLQAAIDANGKPVIVAFMPSSGVVYKFVQAADESFQLVNHFPEVDSAARVLDCQLNTRNGREQLLIAFDGETGLQEVSQSGLEKRSSDGERFVSVSGDGMFGVSDGRLMPTILNPNTDVRPPEQSFSRLFSSSSVTTGYLGTSAGSDGQWYAFGLDRKTLEQKWTSPVGSQLFSSNIQPVASSAFEQVIWAVAGRENTIDLITDSGHSVGRFVSEEPLNGISIVKSQEKLILIVSTESGISGHLIDPSQLPGGLTRPVSHQR